MKNATEAMHRVENTFFDHRNASFSDWFVNEWMITTTPSRLIARDVHPILARLLSRSPTAPLELAPPYKPLKTPPLCSAYDS